MNKLNNKYATITTIIGIIIAITVSIYLAILTDQLNEARKDQIISETQSYYEIGKLNFCIDKAITPCDDTEIGEWNTAHSNDAFKLKTFQMLIEEAIEDYAISRK